MPNKRIEEIKGKITYLNKKRNLDLDEFELDKFYKKLKRKKKSNTDEIKHENDEINNFRINFLFNPITNSYASLARHLLVPNTLGPLISFAGGYLLFSFNILLGTLLVLFSFLFMALVNCSEDRYLIFSNDANELETNEKSLSIDSKNESNIDEMWFTKEELLKLQFSLPWHLSEPEIESADWLNSIIGKVWLQMHNQFNSWLDSNCGQERTLNSFLGNSLLDLKIVESNLGNKSPYISGVRVVKSGVRKEHAILEFELTFDSNLNIQIDGNYLIKFGIKQFYFRSKLRMVAGPLFREMPAVGSITINLIEKPLIDWTFTGCLQILNFKLLKNSISYLIKYWLGQPLKSKLNIAKFLPLRELNLQDPIELIKFDLIEAQNLPNKQMKICCCKAKKMDTYCLVVIDNDEKFTNVRQDADNPEWNQTLIFFIFEKKKESQIQIYIYDEQSDEDELIGYVELSAEFFKSNTSKYNGREFEIQLLDPESKCPLKFGQTKLVFRISWFKLTDKLSEIQKSLELAKNLLPVATLSVLVDSASGLETVVHQVQTPELRILVRITVGNQVQVTQIKERTGYPVFEETLNFMLFNPKLEDIFVEVVDMYWVMEKRFLMHLGGKKTTELNHNLVNLSNDGLVLGYTTIRTTDILNNYQMRKQGTFQLEGYSEEAFIRILITIRLTELSQQIYTNQSQPRIPFPNLDDNLNQIKNDIPIYDILDTKNSLKS